VKPQNIGQTCVLHPPSTHGVHCEFDLKLRSSGVVKNQRNIKPPHSGIVCDALPMKNTKHVEYQSFVK
jgi:hypothetical protein